jgi:hypothetical protein
MNGETHSRSSKWAELLDLALPALDYVFKNQPDTERPFWTLGGGTALALQIDHRVSNDIDIFVSGTKLKLFTPNSNPEAKKISPSYQWPGFYLKFELDFGEIDFLHSGLLTEPGFTWQTLNGRRIALETPEEVIIKKIRYRAEKFKLRDAFDLACTTMVRPGLEKVLVEETPDALPRLLGALRYLEGLGVEKLSGAVVPTKFGESVLPHTFKIAIDLAEMALAQIANQRNLTPGEGSSIPEP